jgi:TolB-like protein/Tfp pilus assembly protein PilF
MQTDLLRRSLLSAAFLVLTFSVATAPPAAAEQPAIAVMPFANLSGNAEQDDLSKVVTDNTVKVLAKVDGLLLVAGGSPVPGQNKSLPEVAKELDVRYVLQGGVQQSGDRVQMTATLSDVAGDKTLWSQNYEREVNAIFDLQDEITRQVVTSLGIQLTPEEQQRIWHRQTNNLEAYQTYLQGREHFFTFEKSDMVEAQKLYEKALSLDPDFATALVALGQTHVEQARSQWVEDIDAAWSHATEAAQKALALDEANPYAFSLLGHIEASRGDLTKSVALAEKAVALAPNDADMNAVLGWRLNMVAAKPKEGLELITKAMHLNRAYPDWFAEAAGQANYSLGNYDDALAAFQEYHKRNPDDTDGYVEIIYTSATAGRLEEAKVMVAELLGKHPGFTVEGYSVLTLFKDPAVNKRIRDNTAKAGLPQ